MQDTPLWTSYLDILDVNMDGMDDFFTTLTRNDGGAGVPTAARLYLNNGDETFEVRPITDVDLYISTPVIFFCDCCGQVFDH